MLLDSMERPLTQSLFLEVGYGSDAIYTLKEVDYMYKGKLYPSLKRLYIQMADPTEYEFANTYLLGLRQWQRITENRALKKHVEEWRFELSEKLRSEGVRLAIKQATKGSWQAAKWLADRGWDQKSGKGRPTKEDIEYQRKLVADVADSYEQDANRLLQ